MTEQNIQDLFTLSDVDGCDSIPFLDIVKEDGSDFGSSDMLAGFLSLASRNYKSLKFDTDAPTLPSGGALS